MKQNVARVALIALFFLPGCAGEKPAQNEIVEPTRVVVESAPTPRADAGNPESDPTKQAAPKIPVYSAFDFLRDYLTLRTYPILFDAKPWINASTNIAQLRDQFGGTTFWDFWGEEEQWETTNHQWQDDAGAWHLYQQEKIQTRDGKSIAAYVLVDRAGPGVMDWLWFTHDTIIFRGDILQHLQILGTKGIEEDVEWGNLGKLGNLRIEVDEQIIFDGAIKDWFSGKAQNLPPDLAKIFVWRYRDFGATGNIIPIPYAKRIKVFVYGGVKPKWFMATGVSLPANTRVQAYVANDLPLADLARLAPNVLQPEKYFDALPNRTYDFRVAANAPAEIRLGGAGTVHAMQLRVPKNSDARNLWLRVKYEGGEAGIDLPLSAFFGDPDQIVPHRSSPLGIIETGDAYLFYSNLPMPYQNGMTLEISTSNRAAIPLTIGFAADGELFNTQLRAQYRAHEKLPAMTPDFRVNVQGDGKLVGIILATKDQDFVRVVTRNLPGANTKDPATHAWPMGYLEANLRIADGAGNARLYSGHEDWAGGGFYFNLGYTTPSGGGNRLFGGILRFKNTEDGYATIYRFFNDLSAFRFQNGLQLSFGHGTWRNNYPVSFGAVVLYYRQP